MKLIRRLKNLWALSEYQPSLLAAGIKKDGFLIANEQAKIISHIDPVDELIQTIRSEDSREA